MPALFVGCRLLAHDASIFYSLALNYWTVGQVHNLPRFTTNIVIDSVIVTDREFSLGLSRLVLTNVLCDRQGGLETRSYGTWG